MMILIFLTGCAVLSSPLLAQTYPDEADMEDIGGEPEEYRESTLRRFEVVFAISIPFAALHSYLAVRGVEMIKQSKVSPAMSRGDWNSIGALTVLFSGFIAFWDYMHTRGEDIQDSELPRGQTEPLLPSMPDAGYRGYQITGTEPMLRLLSGRF